MSTATSDPVFIVDDDPAARDSVAALVRSHGVEAQTYSSAEDFLENFDTDSSGCLVVDVRMTGMTGVQLQQRLAEKGIELPIIMITGFGDVPTAVQAMRAGACTFLEKPCNDQQLWEAIQRALESEAQQRQQRQQKADIRRRLETLTEQEMAVLDRLIAGMPNKSIAKELDLGLRTVEMRRANILKKMGTASVPEMLRQIILLREASTVQSAANKNGAR